jgi:ribosomal protein S18 acetylase RimI-like enzyme
MSEETKMTMRTATREDLDELADLERICFPEAEAATRESLARRLAVYPQHFLLLTDAGRIIGFVNGLASDVRDLTDEMYERAEMHDANGRWQMIFGVDVHPDYRRRGLAEALLRRFIERAREQDRLGLVLTCKDRLVHYYAKLGFVDEGISASTHGGVVWHKMRLTFNTSATQSGLEHLGDQPANLVQRIFRR